jgi:hypothetical protein
MRYADFKKLGMFTGSGAIEGAIKAIVVQRTKQAGMHWTTDGAADIIALRTHPARQRPLERARASQRQLHAARRHLTDTATQTRRPNSRARSSPTMLSDTPTPRGRIGR